MKFSSFIIVLLAMAVSSLAFAGQYLPQAVAVDPVNMTAQGDQWTARNDADGDVYIGCGVRYLDDGAGGVFAFGFCQAEDSDGDVAFCNSENAELLAAIGGISDFSFITFSWELNDAGDAVCNRIGHSTQSFYLPEFRTRR